MSLLVAVTGWDATPWLQRLRTLLPGHEIATPDTLKDRASVRYALSWRHHRGAFEHLPHLKAIFSLGAGVDHVLVDERLPDAPIVRVVDPDLTARMSEWVVLQTLLHFRQFRLYDRQQRERIWAEDERQPAAHEVRVGLLGLGELGRDAARKLQTIGFDVAGWSRTEKSIAGLASFHGRAGLDALLARTDILISPAAVDAADARSPQRVADLEIAARRAARRAVPDQCGAGRVAGGGRHRRRDRVRSAEGRLARRIRDGAVAEILAALGI